ncbi:MAG: tetraacyldisaccharide 4'-kinase [Persephonella sp.]|nr:MAG: tetraacyldisaccharide 4'-kinase [Persephonella sp.]
MSEIYRELKEFILYFLSQVYGFFAVLRRDLYYNGFIRQKSLPRPIISVGNLSVGGTGKTPIVIDIAKKLQERGYYVVVLSRGYKRKSRGTLLVSDGKKIYTDWKSAGDEPYLIAKYGIPVVVSKDRYKAGKFVLGKVDVDVFILDDGFQHYQLKRDVDIVVVDGTKPFWEDEVLPLGRLREPPEVAIEYADIFLINKVYTLDLIEIKRLEFHLEKYLKPVFVAKEKFEKLTNFEDDFPLDILYRKRVGLFAGLGNNKQFFKVMEKLSREYDFCITERISLPDHYNYKKLELPDVDVDYWITTEKDLVKLSYRYRILALKYEVSFDEKFYDELIDRIFR